MISKRLAAAIIRAGVAVFLWALLLPVSAQPDKVSTGLNATMRTQHFAVSYNSKADFQAKLLAEVAEKELLRLSSKLDYSPSPEKPFPLRIYSSRQSFIAYEGLESRKWTVGTTRSITETIALDASGILAKPEEVLAHEIVHAILFRMLGPRIVELPLWFNEGLAQVESGDLYINDDRALTEAAGGGTLIPLRTLHNSFPDKNVDLAYAVSSSAVRYLMAKHGRAAPVEVVNAMLADRSFDSAVLEVTGQTADEFADAWYNHTTRRFLSLRILKGVTAAVSALMGTLAVAAFVARRRRMAQAAKEWDQEEFEEALRRQRGNDWSM